MEDFGHFGDESLFGDYDHFADDFNVFEEQQVFLDNEGGDEGGDEIVEADDVQGFEDDGYEMGLGLE